MCSCDTLYCQGIQRTTVVPKDIPETTITVDRLFLKYSETSGGPFILPDTPEVRRDVANIVRLKESARMEFQAEVLVTDGGEHMLPWKTRIRNVLRNFQDAQGTLSLEPKLVHVMESIILHALTISQCTTFSGYCLVVFEFCHGLLPPDVSISTLFKTFFQENFSHQAGEEIDLMDNIRMVYSCWKSATKGTFFRQFSKGLSIAISLGVLSLDKVKKGMFSRCVDEKFLERLEQQQSNSMDLFDAIFTSVISLLETGIACYKEGNLLPIMWSNDETKAADDSYVTLVNQWCYVQRGAYKEWKVGPLNRVSYDKDLEKTISKYRDFLTRTNDPFLRRSLEAKVIRLGTIQSDFRSQVNNSDRVEPFMVSLWGPSGTGKSTIAPSITRTCDIARERVTRDGTFAVVKSGKFMEGCDEDTDTILDDDVANKKGDKDHSDHTHIDRIIGVKNTAPFFFPKAAVEEKDKTRCLSSYYLTTSNTQDFRAAEYSNCPHSIQGRPDILVEVQVKPEVRLEGGLGVDKLKLAEYEKHNPVDSHYILTVTEAVANVHDTTALSTYRDVVWKREAGNILLRNIDMRTFRAYMSEMCVKHFLQQKARLEKKAHVAEVMKECPVEDCHYVEGCCPVHDSFETGVHESPVILPPLSLPCFGCQSMLQIGHHLRDGVCPKCRTHFLVVRSRHKSTLEPRLPDLNHQADVVAIQAEPEELIRIPQIIPETFRDWVGDARDFFGSPETTLEQDRVSYLELIVFYNLIAPYTWDISTWIAPWLTPVLYARMHTHVVRGMLFVTFIATCILCVNVYMSLFLYFITFVILLYARVACERIATNMVNRNLHRIPEVMAVVKKAAVGTGVFLSMYTLFVTLRFGYRSFGDLSFQASEPDPIADHDRAVKRAAAKSTYYQVRKYPLRHTDLSRTTSDIDHLIKRIYYNTARASFKYLDENGRMLSTEGQVLMLSNHWMLFNRHYMDITKGNCSVILRVDDSGLSYEVRLDNLNTATVVGDVAIAWVCENGCKYHNLEEYLLKEMPKYDSNTSVEIPYKTAYFTRDYEEYVTEGLAALGNTQAKHSSYEYLSFYDENLPFLTAGGMCGAPMVSTVRGFSIVGIHSAGLDKKGAYCIFSKPLVERAQADIQRMLVIPLVSPVSGIVGKGRFGIELLKDDELHPKSPLNYQTETSIQYHSAIVGRSTPRNVMVDTICRKLIEERLGYLCLTPLMAPEINPHWKPWQTWLSVAGKPSHTLPYWDMVRAYEDWKAPMFQIMKTAPKEVLDLIRVLDDTELANGMVGNNFIKPLNFKSVVGGLLPGSKESHCEVVETDGRLIRTFNPQVEDQRRSDEAKLQGLSRCNAIIKGILKLNEANPKPKCRVITGWSAADTMNIRRVCAGPAALMQMYPFVSECMVGMDRHLDWFELRTFLGEESPHFNLMGGDYSKWDARMCSMLIYFAYSYFIEAGMELGFEEKYIKQLISLREEIVYPYIAIAGDLVSLNSGTHASGNAITVHLNCIVNSLLVRCAYFANGGEAPFRDYVKLATYGDDFNAGVAKRCSFNNNVLRVYAGEYGTVVTSAKKEAVMEDYIHELDFLKTFTSKNPDLATPSNPEGVYGCAEMDSILKAARMRSTDSELSDKEHAATVCSDAAYELVFHGRDQFEEIVPKLLDISKELGFYDQTTFLRYTYERLVEKIMQAIESRE